MKTNSVLSLKILTNSESKSKKNMGNQRTRKQKNMLTYQLTSRSIPTPTSSYLPRPIGHVAICVEDLDRGIKFYQSLGLELSYQTADMAYLYSGKQGIALMRVGSEHAKPHFGFACSSPTEVEQIHSYLQDQGVSITPIQKMGEAAAFYAQDPDGNWFEYLYEPPAMEAASRVTQLNRKPKGFGRKIS